MSLHNLNDVRGRDDWYLGLIVRGQEEWSVPLIRHSDRARLEFTMAPAFSMAEVHEEAVRHIEEWEAWVASDPSPTADFVSLYRKALEQIVSGDYPAEAGNAETWAAEVLHDPRAVYWEDE